MNKILLHLEGFTVFIVSLYFYEYNQFSWILFIVLLFTPDISIIGYLFNNKVGSLFYNIIHTYSLSISTVMFGLMLSNQILVAIGLILTAHIGLDRMIGYGLKYPTNFKDTHLNRI